MSNPCVVWVTGTVISDSGYPRKNAEVKGVLLAGNRKLAQASSPTDYSGQYFLTFEAEADARFDERTLKVVLSARSSGQTEEFGELAIDVAGERELERDLRLGPAHPPLAKAA